jgi:hypothetical protein
MHFWFSESESCNVAETGFKLEILLPQPPECWDYRLQHCHLFLRAEIEKGVKKVFIEVSEKD